MINQSVLTFRPLAFAALAVALLLMLPMAAIIATAFTGSFEVWHHLYNTVLADYVVNSLALMTGVGLGVLLLGVPTAWLTSTCDFPGRRIFVWALLLPLAMPAYIIAYTYTGLLDVGGPVQVLLRDLTGWQYGDYRFFEIRSLPGAIIMLSLVLYPYVYLMGRTAFLEQSPSMLEASRTMGLGTGRAVLQLALPMARPAIVAGLTLALMETLADYGTVEYFGVSTFTTGIFRTFYGFGDSSAAAQLAVVLLTFVLLLILLERHSRRQARYHSVRGQSLKPLRLQGFGALLAFVLCLIPVLSGFIVPSLQLFYWSITDAAMDYSFVMLAWRSFYLAFLAAVIAVGLALLLAYAKRVYHRGTLLKNAITLAGTGYALPGTIIAIGVIIPLSQLDHQLIILAEQWLGVKTGLIFSGTLVALLFAYTVRFLAVSLGAVDSGLQKIKPNLDNAARLLGYLPTAVLRKIHLPLLSGSILTGFLIVFVDVLKELPATLILRPFDFNTLAVRAYELASDERLADAAPASLLIVLVGLVPVIVLSRSIDAGRPTATL